VVKLYNAFEWYHQQKKKRLFKAALHGLLLTALSRYLHDCLCCYDIPRGFRV